MIEYYKCIVIRLQGLQREVISCYNKLIANTDEDMRRLFSNWENEVINKYMNDPKVDKSTVTYAGTVSEGEYLGIIKYGDTKIEYPVMMWLTKEGRVISEMDINNQYMILNKNFLCSKEEFEDYMKTLGIEAKLIENISPLTKDYLKDKYDTLDKQFITSGLHSPIDKIINSDDIKSDFPILEAKNETIASAANKVFVKPKSIDHSYDQFYTKKASS